MPTIDYRMTKPSKECLLATVIHGPRTGEEVCILVEFDDGDCVVELPDGSGFDVISSDELRPWVSIECERTCECNGCKMVRSGNEWWCPHMQTDPPDIELHIAWQEANELPPYLCKYLKQEITK
jgi:hypothetical protein